MLCYTLLNFMINHCTEVPSTTCYWFSFNKSCLTKMRCVHGEWWLIKDLSDDKNGLEKLCAKLMKNSWKFWKLIAIFIDNVILYCLYLFRSDHFDLKTDQWYVYTHKRYSMMGVCWERNWKGTKDRNDVFMTYPCFLPTLCTFHLWGNFVNIIKYSMHLIWR